VRSRPRHCRFVNQTGAGCFGRACPAAVGASLPVTGQKYLAVLQSLRRSVHRSWFEAMKLEDLQPNAAVRGLLTDGTATVVPVQVARRGCSPPRLRGWVRARRRREPSISLSLRTRSRLRFSTSRGSTAPSRSPNVPPRLRAPREIGQTTDRGREPSQGCVFLRKADLGSSDGQYGRGRRATAKTHPGHIGPGRHR
jgi:hypothetical protein